MIGIGAALCMVPSCKKSDIKPQEAAASNTQQQEQNGTTMYVMLASKPCSTPQKDYTSVIVDIRSIRVYNTLHGWEELPSIAGKWDLVNMQKENIPGLNITERVAVNSGLITKVAITFGENNKLEVNNYPASCFNLGAREVILDLKGEVKAGAVNEILISMDICGNIMAETNSDGNSCYTLKPVMEFQRLSQKMIK